MAQPFPYTYYACDCYDTKTTKVSSKRVSQTSPTDSEDEQTFDPRNPRSNYALYPLEHLLYCEDCRQIRCPRCVVEETLNWFCPSCLFEMPSSVVKSEGNRCTRNCYNCPTCTSPMIVQSLEIPRDPSEDDGNSTGGPFHLYCPYCHWSTTEIGIEFEKHTGITQQLSRMANGGKTIPSFKERDKERERKKDMESRRKDIVSDSEEHSDADIKPRAQEMSQDDKFAALSAFYKSQIQATMPSNPFSAHDINFSSPNSFTRIMNLYSSTSAKKQKREKPMPMREAASELEGLTLHDPANDTAIIERIRKEGWSSTLSQAQKHAQPNPNVRFTSELRPVGTLLRTKRGKRCRTCRHILSKPESKITSSRYKIKLLALNHIPRLTLRALPSSANTGGPPTPGGGSINPPISPVDYANLKSGLPMHFLLTLTNPLFDPIRVTLATPINTPGKIQSRVTILCPQFDVGANTDVWDDALSSSVSGSTPTTTSTTSVPRRPSIIGPDGRPTEIEAGKIWDKGRNWTSIVVEVVPGFLKKIKGLTGFGEKNKTRAGEGGGMMAGEEEEDEDGELEEDEDVVEIPIFVRLEFEAEVTGEERGLVGEERKGGREKREEAFWTVCGVGRIASE